ncbi:tetratricopeptide repeat protein [Streptomyces mirabilis]|uniref:tetratricopeptide repeat protein n=1 Tax=Streptomyces mirabilis TaxID=68239 RepID=UPI0037F72890
MLLYRLYLEARTPSVARVASLIADDPDELLPGCPSKDTVHRIIGSNEFPGQQANVVSVAAVLAREAGWDVTDAVDRVRSAWVKAHLTEPPGRPLDELDPHALEVHRSIAVTSDEHMPTLPAYVMRDHDHLVQKEIGRAVSGQSVILTLVGESSTGKTRTFWEAIQHLPAKWRLWQALDSASPSDLATDLEKVSPYTVVWLNEAQRFLLTGDSTEGERTAAALRRIMHARERKPVLVLVTLWPKYWDQLTSEPRDGHTDLRPHARHVLDGSSIRVPAAFEPEDLKHLKEASTRDARLAQAAEHAEQNQVTQYLAGVPALIQRYQTAPPPVRALIDAAMDIRRLGYGEHIPLELLEAATYEYLTDLEFDLLPEDWLEAALAHAAKPQRGIRGPLTRVRPRSRGAVGGPVRYRLADPLDQLGREERRRLSPPPELWDLLVRHSNPSDALSIGESAEYRCLYRTAVTLYENSANSGISKAAIKIAGILSMTSRHQEAIEWYEEAHSLGDHNGLRFAAQTMVTDEEVDWDRVKSYYMQTAFQGNLFALHECRDAMFDWEYSGDANKWLKEAIAEFFQNFSIESAIAWCEKFGLEHNLGRLLIISGKRDRGLEVLKRSALEGNFMSMFQVCKEKQVSSGVNSAIVYLKELGHGTHMASHFAPMHLREIMSSDGREEECITFLKEMSSKGNTSAAEQFAKLMHRQGCSQGAITFLFSLHKDGVGISCELADLLSLESRADEAIVVLTPLATAGSSRAQHKLAKILEAEGKLEDALVWYRKSAEEGTYNAAHGAVRLLLRADRASEALTWLTSISDPDAHHERIECAEQVLQSMGRNEEAKRVRQYGWEPDGSISAPWSVLPSSSKEG